MEIETEAVEGYEDHVGFSNDGEQYLTFALGEEQYGLQILRVQEIKGYTGITHIPSTPDYVKGVLNLRGTIVPIVDLRMKFGMEEQAYDKKTVIIVVEVKGRVMGIIVDSVSDVMSIASKDIQPSPDFGSSADVGFINGIGNYGEKLVAFLNIDRILEVGEIGQALDEPLEETEITIEN